MTEFLLDPTTIEDEESRDRITQLKSQLEGVLNSGTSVQTSELVKLLDICRKLHELSQEESEAVQLIVPSLIETIRHQIGQDQKWSSVDQMLRGGTSREIQRLAVQTVTVVVEPSLINKFQLSNRSTEELVEIYTYAIIHSDNKETLTVALEGLSHLCRYAPDYVGRVLGDCECISEVCASIGKLLLRLSSEECDQISHLNQLLAFLSLHATEQVLQAENMQEGLRTTIDAVTHSNEKYGVYDSFVSSEKRMEIFFVAFTYSSLDIPMPMHEESYPVNDEIYLIPDILYPEPVYPYQYPEPVDSYKYMSDDWDIGIVGKAQLIIHKIVNNLPILVEDTGSESESTGQDVFENVVAVVQRVENRRKIYNKGYRALGELAATNPELVSDVVSPLVDQVQQNNGQRRIDAALALGIAVVSEPETYEEIVNLLISHIQSKPTTDYDYNMCLRSLAETIVAKPDQKQNIFYTLSKRLYKATDEEVRVNTARAISIAALTESETPSELVDELMSRVTKQNTTYTVRNGFFDILRHVKTVTPNAGQSIRNAVEGCLHGPPIPTSNKDKIRQDLLIHSIIDPGKSEYGIHKPDFVIDENESDKKAVAETILAYPNCAPDATQPLVEKMKSDTYSREAIDEIFALVLMSEPSSKLDIINILKKLYQEVSPNEESTSGDLNISTQGIPHDFYRGILHGIGETVLSDPQIAPESVQPFIDEASSCSRVLQHGSVSTTIGTIVVMNAETTETAIEALLGCIYDDDDYYFSVERSLGLILYENPRVLSDSWNEFIFEEIKPEEYDSRSNVIKGLGQLKKKDFRIEDEPVEYLVKEIRQLGMKSSRKNALAHSLGNFIIASQNIAPEYLEPVIDRTRNEDWIINAMATEAVGKIYSSSQDTPEGVTEELTIKIQDYEIKEAEISERKEVENINKMNHLAMELAALGEIVVSFPNTAPNSVNPIIKWAENAEGWTYIAAAKTLGAAVVGGIEEFLEYTLDVQYSTVGQSVSPEVKSLPKIAKSDIIDTRTYFEIIRQINKSGSEEGIKQYIEADDEERHYFLKTIEVLSTQMNPSDFPSLREEIQSILADNGTLQTTDRIAAISILSNLGESPV